MQMPNPAALLAGGQSLVPDYAKELLERRLVEVQEQQANTASGNLFLQAQKAQREQGRMEAYEAAKEQLGENPSSQGLIAMSLAFPEFSEDIMRAHKAQDEDRQRRDFSQVAQIHAAARNKRYDLAAAELKRRIEADEAADGMVDDPFSPAILADLESGDPQRQQDAMEALEVMAASMGGPDHYASFRGSQRPEIERKYDFIARTRGKPAADEWLRGETSNVMVVPVEAGGDIRVFDKGRLGGGGVEPGAAAPPPAAASPEPSGASPVPNAAAIVRQMYPGATITDWKRDPKSALGRKNPKSWHNRTGAAVDTVPISGLSFDEYVKSFRDKGFQIIEARDEVKNPSKHATGPHWHVVIGVPKVNSAQQFAALPRGAQFYDPQGNLRRKP